MLNWFNPRKSAQVAAFFVRKDQGEIPVLKLVKLIYLADREHLGKFGHPVISDRLVSMPHGPVNSMTLNFINGLQSSPSWDEFICDRDGYSIGVQREFSDEDLDELSTAEIDTLKVVWDRFGSFNKWQLVDWTHENCPEWEDPQGSARDIPHERVLKHLGVENARSLAKEIRSDRFVEDLFASIRESID
ncbi:MAG: DUF4065 domain-containing protein [Alphaproteobacteria bacterium]|nr:MAG: DUF4065 domain-containing protein [Alphaproteobacteria bacterium]